MFGAGSVLEPGPGNRRAAIGFKVQLTRAGEPIKGALDFVDQASGDHVHADAFTSLTISASGATFEGTGKKNHSTPCTFRVTVQDRSATGSGDAFQISGSCATLGPATIVAGNLVVERG